MWQDDDLNDYEEDYDAVDEILAHFGKKVKEDEAIDALHACDGDLDSAIIKLEKKLASARAAAQSKLAKKAPVATPTAAPAAAQAVTPKGKLNTAALSKPGNEGSGTTSGAPSSLAALIKQRQSQRSDGPASQSTQSSEPVSAPRSKLLQFARNKLANADSASKTPALAHANESASAPKTALERFRAKKIGQAQPVAETEQPATAELRSQPELVPEQPKTGLKIDYKIFKATRPPPSRLGSILGKPAAPTKHTSSFSNTVSLKNTNFKNFTGDSPDDMVIKAQQSAFGGKDKERASDTVSTPAPARVVKPTPPKTELIKSLIGLNIKPHISLVVIGHVDAGKSTLMGRILSDSGNLSKREREKQERNSAKIGKSSFALAWTMDSTTEERERGVTVDVGDAHFETTKARFTILDAPGHRDYVPNMIAGVAQADIAVLVVDADTNAFESGFSLDGQTREHALLARSMGLDQILVAVNKLDTQDWSQSRFDEIQVLLNDFLVKQVGYSVANITYIATSGRSGDFVYARSTNPNASWYEGPTLIEALEATETKSRSLDGPAQFIVSNVFQEQFSPFVSLSGRLISGLLEVGDAIANVSDGMTPATIKAIATATLDETADKQYATAGDIVDLKTDMPLDKCRPGDVIASPDTDLAPVKKIVAKALFFGLQKPVLQGTRVSFYAGRLNISAKLNKVVAIIDKQGNAASRPTKHILSGQTARVEIKFDSPQVFTPFLKQKDLGRFVLRCEGSTIAGGIIESVKDAKVAV